PGRRAGRPSVAPDGLHQARRLLDDPLEVTAVRAPPVQLTAVRAAAVGVVGAARARLEVVLDLPLVDRDEVAVAGGAAGPRAQRGREPAQYVAELVVGAGPADVGAEPQGPAPEQPPVLRQQDPALLVGLDDQRR